MKPTADDIKARINEIVTLFSFYYNGKYGNVDPYSKEEFLLFFDGEDQTVHDIDAVMSTPFIDGKTLAEVADDIEIDEW